MNWDAKVTLIINEIESRMVEHHPQLFHCKQLDTMHLVLTSDSPRLHKLFEKYDISIYSTSGAEVDIIIKRRHN